MLFWWSMVLDHSFGAAALSPEAVVWPADADVLRQALETLQGQWRDRLERLTEADLESPANTRWPFKDRPFADVVAWVNLELAKNAAEIGYARFLHAARARCV
jgi:hypothetical protein